VQDNESCSKYGTLRGLHFQNGKMAQAKLVRVTRGAILDVVVDIRLDSPTFGQFFSTELNDLNKKQFFIPRGMAHGFVTLSDEAIMQYKCDNFYCKEAEGGLNFADPQLAINWSLPQEHIKLNIRDRNFPTLTDLRGVL
jgi:dTDP-4-dehydrorhamnose 3,5-epimerase